MLIPKNSIIEIAIIHPERARCFFQRLVMSVDISKNTPLLAIAKIGNDTEKYADSLEKTRNSNTAVIRPKDTIIKIFEFDFFLLPVMLYPSSVYDSQNRYFKTIINCVIVSDEGSAIIYLLDDTSKDCFVAIAPRNDTSYVLLNSLKY